MKIAKSIECVTTLRLTYDDKSKEFMEAFSDYRESIYPKSTVDEMLCHVANYALKFGSDRLIEGVGYLSVKWCKARRTIFRYSLRNRMTLILTLL